MPLLFLPVEREINLINFLVGRVALAVGFANDFVETDTARTPLALGCAAPSRVGVFDFVFFPALDADLFDVISPSEADDEVIPRSAGFV